MNRAVFLDRDGVIIENRDDYVRSPGDVQILPGAIEAIAALQQAGYLPVVATNQSAIGRGLVSPSVAQDINESIDGLVSAGRGRIAAWYVCPHVPEDGCRCRKPNPGLLEDAARDLLVSLESSYFVGDALSDVIAARAVHVRPVLVLTGRGADTAAADGSALDGCPVVPDLRAAAALILAAQGAVAS